MAASPGVREEDHTLPLWEDAQGGCPSCTGSAAVWDSLTAPSPFCTRTLVDPACGCCQPLLFWLIGVMEAPH